MKADWNSLLIQGWEFILMSHIIGVWDSSPFYYETMLPTRSSIHIPRQCEHLLLSRDTYLTGSLEKWIFRTIFISFYDSRSSVRIFSIPWLQTFFSRWVHFSYFSTLRHKTHVYKTKSLIYQICAINKPTAVSNKNLQ